MKSKKLELLVLSKELLELSKLEILIYLQDENITWTFIVRDLVRNGKIHKLAIISTFVLYVEYKFKMETLLLQYQTEVYTS